MMLFMQVMNISMITLEMRASAVQTKDLMVTFKSRLEGILPYPGLFSPDTILDVSPIETYF